MNFKKIPNFLKIGITVLFGLVVVFSIIDACHKDRVNNSNFKTVTVKVDSLQCDSLAVSWPKDKSASSYIFEFSEYPKTPENTYTVVRSDTSISFNLESGKIYLLRSCAIYQTDSLSVWTPDKYIYVRPDQTINNCRQRVKL